MSAYTDDPHAFDRVFAGGLVRYTERTSPTANSLSRELAQIREAGYAMNWGEWREEARGIAAPVVDSTLRVVAAVGICDPATHLTEEFVSESIPVVVDAANQISTRLRASEAGPHTESTRAFLRTRASSASNVALAEADEQGGL